MNCTMQLMAMMRSPATPSSLSSLPLLSSVNCPKCRLRSVLDSKRRARAGMLRAGGASSPARFSSSISSLSNQSPTQTQTQTPSNSAKWALLCNKRLIRLCGPDAANFLHSITPAKIVGGDFSIGTPIYTAFLSAQGRILQDVFIYPPSSSSSEGDQKNKNKEEQDEWLVEVDANSATDLLKHLKKHKLRAKFAMQMLDAQEATVWYRWPAVASAAPALTNQVPKSSSGSSSSSSIQGIRAGGNDPRPGMGMRLVLNSTLQQTVRSQIDQDQDRDQVQVQGSTEVSLEQYTIHRMINGLAEGQKEIISGHALPQECNLDFLGGIDFHKGCYLGQELTIRTHHTGVVRKRILPCQIFYNQTPSSSSSSLPEEQQDSPIFDQTAAAAASTSPPPPAESNISKLVTTATSTTPTKKGRSTGKWLDGVGNVGLALCRLEMMTDVQLTTETATATYNPADEYHVQWNGSDTTHSVRIRPFVPTWIRSGIEQSLRRKERKIKSRQQQDEEDDDELD